MKRSVLVVDDNQYLARTTAQALEGLGFHVCVASNAKQALKLVVANAFDAAVIDIDLNGRIDGLDLLKSVHEICPSMTAVLATGFDMLAFDAPADVVVLRKPYRLSQLEQLFSAHSTPEINVASARDRSSGSLSNPCPAGRDRATHEDS